MESENA